MGAISQDVAGSTPPRSWSGLAFRRRKHEVRWLLLALLLALISTPALAKDNFPAPSGYVNDFAGVMSAEAKDALEKSLSDFDQRTTVQIAVVTAKDLGGDTIEGYAVHLFEAWGIGRKGADNGILLLVSPGERALRIEVGYGMEPFLTDGQAGRIRDADLRPHLAAGDYDQGLTKGAEAIMAAVIQNGYEPGSVRVPRQAADSKLFILMGAGLASVYAMSYIARTREVVLGAIWGAGTGGVLGWVFGGLAAVLAGGAVAAVIGLVLDVVLSRAYKNQVGTGRPTNWGSSWGGFSGGLGRGHGGGGFGGFGGGHSGGGGASGRF